MSLEQPLINPSEEPSIIPYEQKMEDKKSCCEILCDCFSKTMECCLPCGLFCLLFNR